MVLPTPSCVTATDPAGDNTAATEPNGITTQEVTITINDVNEAPMITVWGHEGIR